MPDAIPPIILCPVDFPDCSAEDNGGNLEFEGRVSLTIQNGHTHATEENGAGEAPADSFGSAVGVEVSGGVADHRGLSAGIFSGVGLEVEDPLLRPDRHSADHPYFRVGGYAELHSIRAAAYLSFEPWDNGEVGAGGDLRYTGLPYVEVGPFLDIGHGIYDPLMVGVVVAVKGIGLNGLIR